VKRKVDSAPYRHGQIIQILVLSTAFELDANCALAADDVYLEVALNGQPTQLIARFREHNGQLSIDGKSLQELGLSLTRLGLSATQQVRLDDLPGLTYRYDAKRQSVALQLADRLREAQRLGRPASRDARTQASALDSGWVLNYDAYASRSDSDNRLALWTEQRYFNDQGVYSNTGTAYSYRTSNQRHYVRLDSSWSHSNPQELTTWQLGDAVSGALDWTRAVRFGGVQYKRNFALRPDLVTFPLPAYSGSAAVPSTVSLYVNGIQRYRGTVNSGPFIIDQTVPGITGSGEAVVVTQDALGRTLSTSLPLYVDTRLMAAGLSSYSLEVGHLRHDYGVDTFRYAAQPAGSGSLRYGVNDQLTLEGHAEASEGVYNAGAGALYQLGQKGVLNVSLAGSAGMAGMQGGLGYRYSTQGFSIHAQSLRSFSHYADLAAYDGAQLPSITDRLSLSFSLARHQHLSLSYLGYKLPGSDKSNIISLGHSLRLFRRLSMVLSLYQDLSEARVRGAFANFSFSMAERTSVNSSVNYQNRQAGYATSINRAPDYDGGWGWGAQFREGGSNHYQMAQARYLGAQAMLTASVQESAGSSLFSLDGSGSLVWMDGHLEAARRIGEGFALVSTEGVPGVPVRHENREIGLTDKQGYFLVPDLDAYRHNKVSINSLNLPANVQVSITDQAVVPQSRAGVVVRFPIQRYQAASVILWDEHGNPLPAGLRVRHMQSGGETLVGYDGITFVEHLAALNRLQVEGDRLHCQVTFPYAPPADNALPTLGPLRCLSTTEEQP
jgi:outer membrane usher protein